MNIDHVPFCEKCHSILEAPDQNNLLRCTYCNYFVPSQLRERKSVRNFDTSVNYNLCIDVAIDHCIEWTVN